MKKSLVLLAGSLLLSSSVFAAGKCSDGLKIDFTFYGAPDKSYVVTKNTFKTIKSNFPRDKLLNATVNIDTFSLDTSADMSNIKAKWPPSMANVRNNNTINNFFKKFTKDVGVVKAKIIKIEDKSLNVEVQMNGVKKEVPFTYVIEGDVLKAKSKLDVLEFGLNDAWKQFTRVCEKGFHHGKSYSTIDLFFEVPASCK